MTLTLSRLYTIDNIIINECGTFVEIWQGKQEYSEKSCPSGTLSTINLTGNYLVSNPGYGGVKPGANRLTTQMVVVHFKVSS
jgi:hypothetical protein